MRMVLLLCLLVMALPGSAAAAGRCEKLATMEEARELALQAADHLAEHGPLKAFADFIDPNGPFLRDDLYVFVFTRDGLMLLNVGFPELIGSQMINDAMGGGWGPAEDALKITKDDGAGWIEYNWINPCTGSQGPKRSFVVGRGDLVIGVGAYGELLGV